MDSLLAAAARTRENGETLAQLKRRDFDVPELRSDLDALRDEVMHGRGFAVLRSIPVGKHGLALLETLYVGLALQLGTPVSQSTMGDTVGRVTDVSSQENNVRPYRSRDALRLHTDFTDISALFCIRPARCGGETSVVSALAVHEEMRTCHPELLEVLYRGYRFHRLGEHAEDEERITPHRVPIFSRCRGLVSCRYSRAYIMEAEHELGVALSATEREALDRLDEISCREDMRVTIRLEAGEIVFMNSHTTLHTRSAFEDWEQPARKRLLLRLWLEACEPRPVLPEIAIYGGRINSIPKRGAGTPAGFERRAAKLGDFTGDRSIASKPRA